ncbi:hypothetical protein LRS10_11110 [Phenylobacterium sp. J426]|uniref:hypothetical protein n=1 Tax=Phenylobacterium sp. J426 TaxID=2898439 RepID=UPI0021510F81|nr:hypothetical protein [Phenylobacterium sp. J426]MCR5874667.1 hypothetical protein [Phenylobacterium sp. J426]
MGPDVLWDLNRTPWPWPADFADQVRLLKTLEYLGPTPERLQAIMRELYRVCRDGATVATKATHPRHQQFLDDPEVVRPITPDVMKRFDAMAPRRWDLTPLAEANDVDFEVVDAQVVLAEPYRGKVSRGELSPEQVAELLETRLDVAVEHRIELRVHKPPRPGRAVAVRRPADIDTGDVAGAEADIPPRQRGHLER